MVKIPQDLQAVLWSTPIKKLDLSKDKVYIIHQVLMYGSFDQINWLFRMYPKNEINNIFLTKPQKVYTKEAFNFIKNYVLKLNMENLSPEKYVNNIYGSV